MLKKKLNNNKQKAYQRGSDHEDREWQYKNWLRTIKVHGFFSDVDMFKFKKIDGQPVVVAITDITRTDQEEVSQHYLDSIFYRIFIRDSQGATLDSVGKALNVPVFLVLFPKSVKWLWVLHFKNRTWKKYTAEEWADYLDKL